MGSMLELIEPGNFRFSAKTQNKSDQLLFIYFVISFSKERELVNYHVGDGGLTTLLVKCFQCTSMMASEAVWPWPCVILYNRLGLWPLNDL